MSKKTDIDYKKCIDILLSHAEFNGASVIQTDDGFLLGFKTSKLREILEQQVGDKETFVMFVQQKVLN